MMQMFFFEIGNMTFSKYDNLLFDDLLTVNFDKLSHAVTCDYIRLDVVQLKLEFVKMIVYSQVFVFVICIKD